ncbi:group III truncated hemoglobin [Stappia sp. ES.058]|uniref:group III truncated hemoglobin n=1 Tax=Stappia sp. ES.058 TaxID=1881061 RepID=UPI0008794FD0|nr:group III truncated hemoglobin [Stappia sp. ES.058]SDT95647.1 hemoglobin [Stappia sp. ES.058]
MTTIRVRSASERRREIEQTAAALGIDDAYISTLVETFYGRVRAHEVLGPIFAAEIGDDWDPHLAKMKDFWASVVMNAGRYSGKPVPAHTKLPDLQPWHFKVWLDLFEQTLADTAPHPDAVPYFMERARRIARSLEFAISGLPPLNAGARP